MLLSFLFEHKCTLLLQSAPNSTWGSLSPPHAMHTSSLFFLQPLRVPFCCGLLLNLSCKHTSASSKCGHTGGFYLPLQFGWRSCSIFWGGRGQRDTPLYPTPCAYILLSLLLSVYQCVGHVYSDLSVWGDGGLQPCPFPWCVIVCFNGDFSLSSFFPCLCISAAAYTCLRGALLAGGSLLAH